MHCKLNASFGEWRYTQLHHTEACTEGTFLAFATRNSLLINVFLMVWCISLIGSVFNIVLVKMDMCSGASKGASFSHVGPKSRGR